MTLLLLVVGRCVGSACDEDTVAFTDTYKITAPTGDNARYQKPRESLLLASKGLKKIDISCLEGDSLYCGAALSVMGVSRFRTCPLVGWYSSLALFDVDSIKKTVLNH